MKTTLIFTAIIFISFNLSLEINYQVKEDVKHYKQQPQYKKESSINLKVYSDLIKKIK